MDERVPVTPGALHDPPSASWKVVYDNRRIESQVREVDNIQIGAITRGNHSTVMESITPSRCHGLFVDQELDREFRAARSITRPDREQAGRRTRVADVLDVGASIGDTANRVAAFRLNPPWAPKELIPPFRAE